MKTANGLKECEDIYRIRRNAHFSPMLHHHIGIRLNGRLRIHRYESSDASHFTPSCSDLKVVCASKN
jgi:hypothetical protein